MNRFKVDGFAAIRRDDTGDYLDSNSFALLREECVKKTRALDSHIPGWAKANPVQRVIRVVMQSEEEA